MKRRDPNTLSKPLLNYYRDLDAFAEQNITHETAVRSAFQNLLADTARTYDWMLIPELGKAGTRRVIPDGTLRDINSLPRGYWEAKDTKDKLDAEIGKKNALGYPLTNIIFEDTGEGVLFSRLDHCPRVGADTLLAQIVKMVSEAQRTRAPIQRLADTVASYFVPAVLAASVITFAVWAIFGPQPHYAHALVNAVAVLIIACPVLLGWRPRWPSWSVRAVEPAKEY
jgi:E1-E2 ATPase